MNFKKKFLQSQFIIQLHSTSSRRGPTFKQKLFAYEVSTRSLDILNPSLDKKLRPIKNVVIYALRAIF
jgi:hypothetical protein